MLPRTSDSTRNIRRVGSFGLFVILAVMLAAAPAFADTTFSITGRGWGHGIGLSQYGAKGYAERGYKYDAIVRHYYPNTVLGTVPNASMWVNLEPVKANRLSWTLRPGSLNGSRLVIGGAAAPDAGAYKFTANGASVSVYNVATGKLWKTVPSPVGVTQSGTAASAIVEVTDTSGPFSRTHVIYRGSMRISAASGKLKLINAVPIESYLRGVVPRESPSSWHMEALKSQAVTARSYAYTSSYPAGSGIQPKELYCTTMSQVYHGVGRRDPSGYVAHEVASTDLAVSSTGGRAVMYLGKPVTTFFSSSSGGHTADLADVWGPTEAHYWSAVRTGVPDPYEAEGSDGSGPAVSWGSPIVKSGASIASALDYSSPVVRIDVVRGTGDFAKSVSIRLADGTAVVVSGDRFRSKLGLRSTKFWIRNNSQAAAGSTRFEDTDDRLVYGGTWNGASKATLSGGVHHYSATAGSTVTIPFRGTAIAWSSVRGPAYGRVEVFLDGVSQGQHSLYSPTVSYRSLAWVSSALADGPHTLEIKVLGTKDANSVGTYVSLDGLFVKGSIQRAGTARFEQSDSRISRTGWWATSANSVMSGGSYTYSKVAWSKLTIPFSGTSFDLVGCTAPSFGKLELLVDGVSRGTFDAYSKEWYYRQLIASVSGLTPGAHVATVRVTGLKNPASSAISIGVDAIDVAGTLVPVRVEESDTRLAFSDGWQSASSSVLSGGGMRYSTTPGSSVTVRFKGTQVALVGNKSASYGDVRVRLDGNPAQVVSLRTAATAYGARVWSAAGLADVEHTVTFEVIGNGTVALDRVDVTGTLAQASLVGGPAAPVRTEETSEKITFSGTWKEGISSSLSGGSMKYADTAGATATFTTVGTDFSLISNRARNYGSARVYVDGKMVGTALMNAPTTSYRQRVFSYAGLTRGVAHVVRIQTVGDGVTALDAFDVR